MPTDVVGKEYSNLADRDSAGAPDPLQTLLWDGLGGVSDGFDHSGSVPFEITSGEIWVWDFGAPATFLVHGGVTWDTAHDIAGRFGVATDEIDALEAVPEPAAVILLALGGLMATRRRREL